MHFEERMPKMGVDCDALPNGLPRSPKHPLSKSLRRSASNRAINRGHESSSLLNQAILKNSRGHNLEYHKPQHPSSPKTLFSLQTTPPLKPVLPPKPSANSKHFSRSLTFSSIERESERKRHRDCKPNPSTAPDHIPNLLLPEANVVTKKDDVVPISSLQDSEADGPSIFSKSLFRSSSFSGLRDLTRGPNASTPSETGSRRLSTGSPSKDGLKGFMRSSSFAHKQQESPTVKSFSRSSSAGEPAREQKADLVSSFSKWARSFRSKPAADQGMEIPESSPYCLLSRPADKRASPRVSPIVEIENSFGVLTKGFLDSSRNAVKAVQDKAQLLLNKRFQVLRCRKF
jgi:phosphatidylinositol-3,4,5-trisphosphate 3-phosphatase/dual-specificity protein phosphatase PTEN